MADTNTATAANAGHLRNGAERFRTLLQRLHAETERQLGERADDFEAGIDVLDYASLARMVEEHLPSHGEQTREGFMRSLADVLGCFADGCTYDIDEALRLAPIGGDGAMSDAGAAAQEVANAMPGLRKVRRKTGTRDIGDAWFGTVDAIVAAGLATPDEFPGQPGRPKSSVAYRPAAGKQGAYCWDRAPGYRRIARAGDGFRIDVTASSDEQDRRVEAEETRRQRERQEAKRAAAVVLPLRTGKAGSSHLRVIEGGRAH